MPIRFLPVGEDYSIFKDSHVTRTAGTHQREESAFAVQ